MHKRKRQPILLTKSEKKIVLKFYDILTNKLVASITLYWSIFRGELLAIYHDPPCATITKFFNSLLRDLHCSTMNPTSFARRNSVCNLITIVFFSFFFFSNTYIVELTDRFDKNYKAKRYT